MLTIIWALVSYNLFASGGLKYCKNYQNVTWETKWASAVGNDP